MTESDRGYINLKSMITYEKVVVMLYIYIQLLCFRCINQNIVAKKQIISEVQVIGVPS